MKHLIILIPVFLLLIACESNDSGKSKRTNPVIQEPLADNSLESEAATFQINVKRKVDLDKNLSNLKTLNQISIRI